MGVSSNAGEREKNISHKKYNEEDDYEDYDEGQIEKEIKELESKEKEIKKENEKINGTINALNNKLKNGRIELIKLEKRLKYLNEIKQNPEIISERRKNKEVNNVLEQMCIFGEATKKQIREEKIKHPEKFIDTNQALKMENKDQGLFTLALLSKHLENLGIETAIEKDENPKEQNNDLQGLQFLFNGMINRKKYDLNFEFGEQRNKELAKDKKEYEKFKKNLKLKLSKDYNIPPEKIVVTLPTLTQKGNFRVQVIFQSEEFNNLDKNHFINKFKNDPDFDELKNLKDIQEDIIMGGVKLTRNQLAAAGNRKEGWAIGEKRGGKEYHPPIGWNGIGLKVTGKYDNGDDKWIGMCNGPGEWCVAYHGVGRGQSSDKVKKAIGAIYKTTFEPGSGQVHKNHQDVNHPGQKVGEGVYCTPFIETAEGYAGISNINGINYKTVFMVRVKPNVIRSCADQTDYWVVNGTTDEIRPYRILYKKC